MVKQRLKYYWVDVLINGNVLVVGGYGICGSINFAEIYNSTTGEWTVDSRMMQKRDGHTASVFPDSTVLVVGGYLFSRSCLESTEIYHP